MARFANVLQLVADGVGFLSNVAAYSIPLLLIIAIRRRWRGPAAVALFAVSWLMGASVGFSAFVILVAFIGWWTVAAFMVGPGLVLIAIIVAALNDRADAAMYLLGASVAVFIVRMVAAWIAVRAASVADAVDVERVGLGGLTP